jgi:HSP20 family protein
MSLIKRNNGNAPAVRTFFSDFFDNDKFFSQPLFKEDWFPSVNVVDGEKSYEIELAAPGFKKEDFRINVENGILNISAETKAEEEEKKKNFTRREFSYNSFSRSFTLPENASEDKIEAKYENGVLKLDLAKKALAAPKKKEIAVA